MGYRVEYASGAWKVIEKFDRSTQKRILAFVDRIEASSNPRFSGKALKGNDNEWRYRVGDYRLVLQIANNETFRLEPTSNHVAIMQGGQTALSFAHAEERWAQKPCPPYASAVYVS